MPTIDEIAEIVHRDFELRTKAREDALSVARRLTRTCADAVRAVHRGENALAEAKLAQAKQMADSMRSELLPSFAELYYAGYTQDALKEFAEASAVYALINFGDLPSPEELGIPVSAYIRGLAEAIGELRRKILDLLRHGHSPEVERLLADMDEIYSLLVTVDYPDAVTMGLRRLTDIARSLLERTRGDVTLSLRQERLENALREVEARVKLSPHDC